MIVVLLGPPGAGKGTQADALVRLFKFPHISTGEIFRTNLKRGTALGLEAQTYMSKGDLVPDELVIRLVEDRLSKPDAAEGCLLDGFPRTLFQAQALDKFLASQGKQVDACLNIEVIDEELVTRLTGRRTCRGCGASWHQTFSPPPQDGRCPQCRGEIYQRPDDSEGPIKERLRVYHEQTSPLIDWYKEAGCLKSVSGRGTPLDVEMSIATALKHLR